MMELLAIITVSTTAFIGTNLDNLVLLIALHTHYRDNPAAVTAGYITGMLLIGVVFLLASLLGELIPIAYLGLLGIIPITAGALGLVQLLQKKGVEEAAPGLSASNGPRAIFTTLVMTQLGNSTDTIITFSALLAESSDFFQTPDSSGFHRAGLRFRLAGALPGIPSAPVRGSGALRQARDAVHTDPGGPLYPQQHGDRPGAGILKLYEVIPDVERNPA